MQHYRLPTRLLDWTESPFIALFFAVTESTSTDGALWAMSPYALNEAQIKEMIVLNPRDPRPAALIARAFSPSNAAGAHTLAIYPDEMDVRISVQLSTFTIHGIPDPLEDLTATSKPLTKFLIPAQAKETLAMALINLGIRGPNLFPDLEHLAADLATMEFRSPTQPPSGAA
jgi:hypothetical protein